MIFKKISPHPYLMRYTAFYFLFFILGIITHLYADASSSTTPPLPVIDCGESMSYKPLGLFDKEGFFWYSTPCGLVKETGNERLFFPFKKIGGEKVTILKPKQPFLSSTGDFWLLSEFNSIYRFNIYTGKASWVSFHQKYHYRSIIEDDYGNIWIATEEKKVFKIGCENAIETFEIEDPKQSNKAYEIDVVFELFKGDSQVFIKNKNSVYRLSGNSFKPLLLDYEPPSNTHFLIAEVGELFEGQENQFFYYKNTAFPIIYNKTINRHLFYFPDELYKLPFYSKQPRISHRFFVNKDHFLSTYHDIFFVNAVGNRIHTYGIKEEDSKKTVYHLNTYEVSSKIKHIYLGKDYILAITFDGIEFINFEKKNFNKFLNDNTPKVSVRVLLEDANGEIYAQTNNGLYKSQNNTFYCLTDSLALSDQERYLLKGGFDMVLEGDSILWTVGIDEKLHRLDLHAKSGELFKCYECLEQSSPLTRTDKRDFLSILQLSENELLLGGDKGLYVFNTNKKLFINKNRIKEDLIVNLVNDIVRDPVSGFWIASDKGVLKLDEHLNLSASIQFPDEILSEIHALPYKLYFDAQGLLWVIFEDNLIVKLDVESNLYSLDPFFREKNLRIASIINHEHDIWISTYNGLYLIKDNDPIQKLKFNTVDGLTHFEFNRNSALLTTTGSILLGTLNGITAITKNTFNLDEENKLLLLGYEIRGENNRLIQNEHFGIRDISHFHLPNKNNLKLEFGVSNSLQKAEDVTYYYRFLNEENNWTNTLADGILNIQYLSAGTHTLEVFAENNNGIKTNTLTYYLHVENVIYKKTWFIILVLLVVVFVTFMAYKHKLKLQHEKHQAYTNIQKLNMKFIQSQMNPHFIFNTINNLQNTLLGKKTEEINFYFNEFAKLVRFNLEFMRIEKHSLQNEINYIKTYIAIQELRFNHDLIVNYSIDDKINPTSIYIPPLLLQPFIENALLHGFNSKEGKKRLIISFSLHHGFLNIEINDNGIGRSASLEKKMNQKFKYKSLSSEIIDERIKISNRTTKGSLYVIYIDKTPKTHGEYGTIVKIIIKL